MKRIPLTKGLYAIVDDEDYARFSEYKWRITRHRNKPYAERVVAMSRVIVEARGGMVVDHINGDTLDNRKCNLRICTHAENMMNMAKSRANKSGFTGVSYDSKRKQWVAQICHRRKAIHLGRFNTPEEAARVYNAKALELRGEFARLNLREEAA